MGSIGDEVPHPDAAPPDPDSSPGFHPPRPRYRGRRRIVRNSVCCCQLREGDVLVITRLDRLAHSVGHLIDLGAQLRERGIRLIVLEQGIDTAEGRAMFSMMPVLADLQRELVVTNTRKD